MSKFKQVSRIPISEIERQQARHRRDLIQPRLPDGTINLEFVKEYGTKALFISDDDIKFLVKKGMDKILNDASFKKQISNNN